MRAMELRARSRRTRRGSGSRTADPVLVLVEAGVEAGQGEELFVAAGFGYVAVLEDDDLVGVADGGEAVGDDEGGAAFHEPVEGVEEEAFAFAVEGAGGFVQD